MTERRLIHTQRRHTAIVIAFQSEVTQFVDAELFGELDQVLKEISEAGGYQVVVDLGQLDYFGSLILEAMRKIWTLVEANGGRMVICRVADVSREVLHIAHFDTLWPIAASVDGALALLRE